MKEKPLRAWRVSVEPGGKGLHVFFYPNSEHVRLYEGVDSRGLDSYSVDIPLSVSELDRADSMVSGEQTVLGFPEDLPF